MPALRRDEHRRLRFVASGVHLRAVLAQKGHDRHLPAAGGEMQRRVTADLGRPVDVDPLHLEQLGHHGDVAQRGGHGQDVRWLVAVLVEAPEREGDGGAAGLALAGPLGLRGVAGVGALVLGPPALLPRVDPLGDLHVQGPLDEHRSLDQHALRAQEHAAGHLAVQGVGDRPAWQPGRGAVRGRVVRRERHGAQEALVDQ
mmetsp:Transcript_101053/g.309037  ORF Transcript_101053/g.309037 Transcript_101053/m.309037 type:complete len:200 (+) Transcript_101053:581-1180(+)